MGKFVLSREALEDLDFIWGHIAQDNPQAADLVPEAAYGTCTILAGQAELGRLRKFSSRALKDVRSFVIPDYPNYVIFYRVIAGGVEIVRVVHGARDIAELFGDS